MTNPVNLPTVHLFIYGPDGHEEAHDWTSARNAAKILIAGGADQDLPSEDVLAKGLVTWNKAIFVDLPGGFEIVALPNALWTWEGHTATGDCPACVAGADCGPV